MAANPKQEQHFDVFVAVGGHAAQPLLTSGENVLGEVQRMPHPTCEISGAPVGSSPVVMVVEWDVPSGQACPVTTALQSVMLSTRRQHGCLGCSLATEVGERVTLHYQEVWATEDDLKAQVQSDRFTTLAMLIESATDPPRVEFALPGGQRGFDYVFELRQAPERRT